VRLTRKKRRRRSRKDTAVAWGGLALKPRAALGSLRGPKLLSLFLLLALGWLTFQLFNSERFTIHEAFVYGNRLIPAETIYEQSGLRGRCVFFLRPRRVEAAIAQIPQVKEVRVSIGLPSRAYIEVQEVQPVVAWHVGEARQGVDEGGRIVPVDKLEGLLVIEDLDGVSLQPDDQIDTAVIHTALELRDLLPEASHLGYSRATGIIFTTAQGWPVYFDPGEKDLAWKVAVLRALLRDLETMRRSVEFIDLRFRRPYYRAG
jgi:cell division septal protein FtsQ